MTKTVCLLHIDRERERERERERDMRAALWDCVSRVCGGGGGCASGGVPPGAGPCCPDVGRCLSGV